jgi:hypothetical protein
MLRPPRAPKHEAQAQRRATLLAAAATVATAPDIVATVVLPREPGIAALAREVGDQAGVAVMTEITPGGICFRFAAQRRGGGTGDA